MLQVQTAREMINKLMTRPQYNLSALASALGVHVKTLRKLQTMDDYQLMPAKQLALIKLYCTIDH